MEYTAPENIYWLFSSSAQAIAAFIGFLSAGLFFIYERLDKQVEKDETLIDIYKEIRIQFYQKIKILFILTGSSIVLSLFVVFLNKFHFGCIITLFYIVVALLNVFTIFWAIKFVIFIINPEIVPKIVSKLIERNSNISKKKSEDSVSNNEYLLYFYELVKILKDLAIKQNTPLGNYVYIYNIPISELINNLLVNKTITLKHYTNILNFLKIRNLAANSQISYIPLEVVELLKETTTELKNMLNDEKIKK